MVMPWLFAILVVIAVVTIIWVFVTDRRSQGMSGSGARKPRRRPWSRWGTQQSAELPRRPANSASLFQLPAVYARIRSQRRLHALLAVLLVACLLGASAIAGRPVRVTERSDALANRDIVLCLDVSSSMVRIDSSVLTTFSDILEDFDGERVGLVAWNSAAQTIVPLTDDYDLLRQQMEDLGDVLDIDPDNATYKQQLRYAEAFSGTVNSSVNGSSLAGDGLASCAQAFDNQGLERSRSIILATDNQVIDPDREQIYSLPDAVDLLSERKIRLFSIYGADDQQSYQYELEQTPEESREELKTLTEKQGKGRFYDVEDSGTGGDIVKQLEKTEVSALGGRKQTRRTDVPQMPIITLSLVLLGYLGLTTWRRA